MDDFTSLLAQVEALSKKVDRLTPNARQSPTMGYGIYDGYHASVPYQVGNPYAYFEQPQFGSNWQPSYNDFSNTYCPNWRNHSNFSWSNNQNATMQRFLEFQVQEEKSNLEELLNNFI